MKDPTHRGTGLWDLAVLTLVYERPMHPYEMQKVLKQRHKDEILGLKPGSLYHAIHRLESDGHIAAKQTGREGRRPERTIYEITEDGRKTLFERLKHLISTPRPEPSVFLASLSFLVYLSPQQAIEQLRQRTVSLDRDIEQLGATMVAASAFAGRINLLEVEYARAMQTAERMWIDEIIDEIQADRLTWDIDELLTHIREAARQE